MTFRRRVTWTLAMLIGLTTFVQPAPAQAARGGYRALAAVVDEARTGGTALPAPLARRLTLAVDGEPLARVLDELARRAGIGIAYTDDVARAPRVRLRAEPMTVAELLLRVTRGTGFSAWVDPSGQVVVRPGAPASGRDAPATRGTPVRVSGYVRRLDSREVVRHATITVAGDGVDSARTATNADGFYFVRLTAGAHVVRVRALGFAPLDTTIDVDAPMALELRLAPVAVALARTDIVERRVRSDVDPQSPDMSVARLDMPAIRLTPAVLGEVDPIRSLTLLPGVSRSTDFSTAFSVRGGSADQNLILLDEATIYNPAHVLGFLSVFNADAVDDVTLHKGAIPARYGGRLSSVLDVRQREGNANAFAGSASLGLLSSRATVEGPLPRHSGSFLVAARRSYADLFLRFARDSAVRQNEAYFYDVNAKTSVRLGGTGMLMASGYVGRDIFEPSRDFQASWGNVSGTLRWNQIVAGRLFSKVTLYGSDYDYSLNFRVLGEPVRWTSRIASRALRIDETLHLSDRHSIEFGLDAVSETVRPGDLRARDTVASAVGAISVQARHGLTGAAYVGHQIDLGSRVSLRYGGRLSGFARRGAATIYQYPDGAPVVWNESLGRYDARAPTDSTRYAAGRTVTSFGAVEPRASARLALTPNASLKASYARTVQYLLLASRTNAPTPIDIWEPVGPYLKPQRADQVALGWAATLGGGAYEISAETYAKRSRNVVDFVDGTDVVLNPRLETGIVQGVGRAYGLELFARRKTGATTGWISYTLGRSEQRFSPAGGGGIDGGRWFRSPTDKTHDLSIVALRPLGTRWTLGGVFTAASGLPATLPLSRYEVDGLVVAEYGPRNGTRLPTYHRLDLSLTRTAGRGELQFGVYNAYNRFNAQSLSFRQSERDPRVTEAVQLSVFGIVPSISYTRRF